ncbi:hypothetical protein [Nonomuraea sp. LPB2021202275-12-8]|uniref:DODA-type extradiol aromatic ring-opening family dioxygenase n=1 Tax=Nonomuraea sp. LPB2021202275-12-8 TaxID=3120159 RepID=UPI00300C6A0C
MIVLGVGASHSTLMNTHWEQTAAVEEAKRFRDGLAEARRQITAARPDTVVIVGSNHFRGFWLDLIPAFTIGVGECVASGESGTPSGPQQVDVELARQLTDRLVECGFDPAFSARLQIDHGQSHAIQYLLDGLDVPIVPLVVNVFAPPLPTLRRCAQLGDALREALTDHPRRIAVIASGGLSHRLPWPDWRDPRGDDEEFMVSAWLDGRTNWRSYDERRRAIVRAAEPAIAPDFDREFLALLEQGRAAELCTLSSDELQARAGNGAHEIRCWLIMAAALAHAPSHTISYDPVPDWLTGMAVAVLSP